MKVRQWLLVSLMILPCDAQDIDRDSIKLISSFLELQRNGVTFHYRYNREVTPYGEEFFRMRSQKRNEGNFDFPKILKQQKKNYLIEASIKGSRYLIKIKDLSGKVPDIVHRFDGDNYFVENSQRNRGEITRHSLVNVPLFHMYLTKVPYLRGGYHGNPYSWTSKEIFEILVDPQLKDGPQQWISQGTRTVGHRFRVDLNQGVLMSYSINKFERTDSANEKNFAGQTIKFSNHVDLNGVQIPKSISWNYNGRIGENYQPVITEELVAEDITSGVSDEIFKPRTFDDGGYFYYSYITDDTVKY